MQVRCVHRVLCGAAGDVGLNVPAPCTQVQVRTAIYALKTLFLALLVVIMLFLVGSITGLILLSQRNLPSI